MSLGPLKLGWARARARATLTRWRRTHNGMDNFCLAGGPGIRAGYPSAALLGRMARRRRSAIAGRIVIALTANRRYALDGIRPGTRLAAVRRRLSHDRPLRIGRNAWYVIPGRRSNGLLKVQHGKVDEVGIVSRPLTRTRVAQRRLLTSF